MDENITSFTTSIQSGPGSNCNTKVTSIFKINFLSSDAVYCYTLLTSAFKGGSGSYFSMEHRISLFKSQTTGLIGNRVCCKDRKFLAKRFIFIAASDNQLFFYTDSVTIRVQKQNIESSLRNLVAF